MRIEMPEQRKKYDREIRSDRRRDQWADRAQVARDLGVHEGTQGNWVNRAREAAEGINGQSKDDVVASGTGSI